MAKPAGLPIPVLHPSYGWLIAAFQNRQLEAEAEPPKWFQLWLGLAQLWLKLQLESKGGLLLRPTWP